MKTKIGLILIGLVATLSVGQYVVYADDDEHEDDEKYEQYEEKEHHDKKDYYEKGDDDEYDDYEGGYGEGVSITEQGSWNIWTRSEMSNSNELPFNDPKIVDISIDNNPIKCYIIPKNGELFAPVKKITKALTGQVNYYKTSKIMKVQLQDEQLIFRVGTNVVYENLIKTPMPSKAFQFNNDLYVPISVVFNAYGYSIEWQEKGQQIICQALNQ